MYFYSKWALDGNFLINHVEVMPWSIYSWLFQLSKYGNFCILMIFEPSFENHDQVLIKWCLWLQKEILTKNLDFWLSNDHFAPTVDCRAIRFFWLCNFVLWVLKLGIWMLDHVYRHVGLDWTLGNFIYFVRTKTLILTVKRPLNCATLGEILKHALCKS